MVYGEEDRFVYRASSCGACIKALVAARMGMEPVAKPDWLERVAEEGILHESAVINSLITMGYDITERQLEVEILLPSAVIRGHCDGKIVNALGIYLQDSLGNTIKPGVQHLLEIKSMGKSVFERWTAKRFDDESFNRYAVQLSLYMHDTKLPGMLVAKCRDDGRICITVYPTPPINPADIIRRMIKVEFAAREGKLPAECDKKDFFCSYPYLCDRPDRDIVTGVNEVALNAWAKQYREAAEQEKKYVAIKEEARGNLLSLMRYVPSDQKDPKITGLKIQSGRFTVSAYENERESISIDKLRSAFGPDAINPYVSISRFPVLRVKEKEADAKTEK